MFCRQCGYCLDHLTSPIVLPAGDVTSVTRSIRQLTQYICPECGHRFNPAKLSTVSNSPRVRLRKTIRAIARICFIFLVLTYIAGYLYLVRGPESYYHLDANTYLVFKSAPQSHFSKPPWPRYAFYRTRYTNAAHTFFAPLNFLDRHIRREYWLDYGVERSYIAASKIAQAGLASPDKKLQSLGQRIRDQIETAENMYPNAKQRKNVEQDIAATCDSLTKALKDIQ